MTNILAEPQTVYKLDPWLRFWYIMGWLLPVYMLTITIVILLAIEIDTLDNLSIYSILWANIISLIAWYMCIFRIFWFKLSLFTDRIELRWPFKKTVIYKYEIQWFKIKDNHNSLLLFIIGQNKKIYISKDLDKGANLRKWIYNNYSNIGDVSAQEYESLVN